MSAQCAWGFWVMRRKDGNKSLVLSTHQLGMYFRHNANGLCWGGAELWDGSVMSLPSMKTMKSTNFDSGKMSELFSLSVNSWTSLCYILCRISDVQIQQHGEECLACHTRPFPANWFQDVLVTCTLYFDTLDNIYCVIALCFSYTQVPKKKERVFHRCNAPPMAWTVQHTSLYPAYIKPFSCAGQSTSI
jgi:hypothetical protein